MSDILKQAHEGFRRQSEKMETESEAILNTVEGLWNGKKETATLSQRMERIGCFVGHVISTRQSGLEKRRKCLANKQSTNRDWDDFYNFCTASHRTKAPTASSNKDAFEVNDADRAQVANDIQYEVDRALEDDIEAGDPLDLPPPSPKKKRNPSPPSAPPGFRIPKCSNPDNQCQRGRSTSRASHSSASQDDSHHSHQSNQASPPPQEDFGSTHAPAHKTTYYRNQGRHQQHQKGGRDAQRRGSPPRSSSPSRDQLLWDRDQLRQQLMDMGRRLDQLEHW